MADLAATAASVPAGDAGALRLYDDTGTHHPEDPTLLGFWLYLMSDTLVFAALFACYGVLGRNYAGGPTGAEIFELPLAFLMTSQNHKRESRDWNGFTLSLHAIRFGERSIWGATAGILRNLCEKVWQP